MGVLPGMSLSDALQPHSSQPGVQEEKHMQPQLTRVLRAAADAVKGHVFLVDTHSNGTELRDPDVRPDCTGLAAACSTCSQHPHCTFTAPPLPQVRLTNSDLDIMT